MNENSRPFDTETDQLIASCVQLRLLYAAVRPSGFLSHSKAATHMYAFCVYCLQWVSRMRERREKRRCFSSSLPFCCQSPGLYFHPRRKKKKEAWLWESVRVESKEGKVKAKNERNRKTTYRKKFMGQARKQSGKRSCCGVVSEFTAELQWPTFYRSCNKRGHRRF